MLIFELFSGVGFCNQVFSLENAIYLSNVFKRKLILIIKNPLCHCGVSKWEYGLFTVLFKNFHLPYGYTILYKDKNLKEINMYENLTKSKECITLPIPEGKRFSNVVLVDPDTKSEKLTNFCNNRYKVILDYDKLKTAKYIYINQSNASRVFYNFFTTLENYKLMNKIGKSLLTLNDEISEMWKKIILPEKYICIHFRFGDVKHSTQTINENTQNSEYIIKWIHEMTNKNTNKNQMPILIMCDRKDHKILKLLESRYQIIYTDELVEKSCGKIVHESDKIKHFLLEKKIAVNATFFSGYISSTVSNYIQYERFLLKKDYYHYTDKKIIIDGKFDKSHKFDSSHKFDKNSDNTWVTNNYYGNGIAWKVFWPDNVFDV